MSLVNYQLPTPYSFPDIALTRFYRSRSLRQGQRSNPGQTMTLHTYTSKPMSLPSINFLHLTVSKIQPGQDFIGQGHNGKVKSWSDHDVAHLHLLTIVPTKYQLPTPYGFRDIARTRFFPPPAHPDTMGENNTPTALKGCGVKMVSDPSTRPYLYSQH